VSVTASSSSDIVGYGAAASAELDDTIQLSPPPSQLPGNVVFRYRLTGDVLVGPGVSRGYCVDLITAVATGSYCARNTGVSISGPFTFGFDQGALTVELDYSFDNLEVAAAALLGQFSMSLSADVHAGPGESGSIDLSHTLTITEISVRDLDGNLIPGVTLTSDNGFNYPFLNALDQPETVAEPASLAILGAGLAGIVALRRRR
jgi:hypothetical protein